MRFENIFGSVDFKENMLEFSSKSKTINFRNWLKRRNAIKHIPYRDIKSVAIKKITFLQWLFYFIAVMLLIQGFVTETKKIYLGDGLISYDIRTKTMEDHLIGIISFIVFMVIGFWYSKTAIAKVKGIKVRFYDGKLNYAFVYASQNANELETIKKEVLSKISAS